MMTAALQADERLCRTWLRPTIPAGHNPHRANVGEDSSAIQGFEFLGVLGRGGMAVVYKARQSRPRRLVAVKVIDSRLAGRREVVERFRQEQAVAARLNHPNLVAAYQAGTAASRPYLVLELVRGDSL